MHALPRQLIASVPPPTILLVDDNPDTLEMYALGLQLEGFVTRQAADGERALAALEAGRPDCIVTDVRMPRMNGMEFRRMLGRAPSTADIPVIALTGAVTPGEVQTARAAGFDSILLKPCLPEILAREIMRVLTVSRAARARASEAGTRATQALARAASAQARSSDTGQRHQGLRDRLKDKEK
jgi:CheY-like chemotaxis protein